MARARQPDLQAQVEGDPPDRQPRDPLAGPTRPVWMERPKTPEDDLIQRAEQFGLSAIANILRAQRDDSLRVNSAAVLPTPPARQNPEATATNQAMNALIDQLSYDLPYLELRQRQREDRVNNIFELGEELDLDDAT